MVGGAFDDNDAKEGRDLKVAWKRWVYDLGEIGRGAPDRTLLSSYVETDREASGVAYIQRLIDGGQHARAKAAAEDFATTLVYKDPLAAFEWANNLPDSMWKAKKPSVVMAYKSLKRQHPDIAEEKFKEITNEELREMLK
ncbi:MAG: hypothetical protein R3F11_25415 [Verrucomicrobiales bacterium]